MQISRQLLNEKFMINNLKYRWWLKKKHLQFWIVATMTMSEAEQIFPLSEYWLKNKWLIEVEWNNNCS